MNISCQIYDFGISNILSNMFLTKFNLFGKILVNCLLFVNKFVYHRIMKKICRNLSIGLGVITIVILAVSISLIARRSKGSRIIYAETIRFSSTIGSFEMLIDNELIVDAGLVQITPSNCSFQPMFTIKKSTEDSEIAIVGNKHSFETAGSYTLYCKIQSNENYYITDSINIKVVSNPTKDTSMYINKLPLQTFYVDDIIELEKLAEIYAPNSSSVALAGDEYTTIEDGTIKAIRDGVAILDIKVTYENITIVETISFIIKPKIQDTGVDLILSINGNILEQNNIEIPYSQFNFAINYELTNLEQNQNINCWTDSDIVGVVSYNSPIIILKTLGIGTATIYVSPTLHPEVVFEIIVTII